MEFGAIPPGRAGLEQGGQLHSDPHLPPLVIAHRLLALAEEMRTLGVAMDYYGGFSPMAAHGQQLFGAGEIARGWGEAMLKEAEAESAEAEEQGRPA